MIADFPKGFFGGRSQLLGFGEKFSEPSETRASVKNFPGFRRGGETQPKAWKFPKGFFWGSSTSAHQVEGNNHNDWTEWEIKNAKIKSQTAKLRNWPDYILEKYPTPLQEENYISGRASDHYNRFREDFDIVKTLGHNAHRFSIEWSRIEPAEGKFDDKEIKHYRDVIRALRERGVEPLVTLWHWPLPLWLRDKGGWESKDIVQHFLGYVEYTVRRLGDLVTFWVTLNEPEIYTLNSYLRGIWPPQKKSLVSYLAATLNLIAAHKKAYEMIHAINPVSRVGVAKNNTYFEGWPAGLLNWFWNRWFLNQIKNHQDFIGLNYYFHKRLWGFRSGRDSTGEISDMGWEIYPEGIYHALMGLKRYGRPVYITENGVADARDAIREKFIKEHLRWAWKVIQKDIDVRGYFYWSLLDNFEWNKGFWPCFGLVEVDYKTQERKIRPSAWEYKKIIEANGVEL